MTVHVVLHAHQIDGGGEDIKLIGVYTSQEKAEQAVMRLQGLEGFKDAKDGFSIDPYDTDRDYWVDGYISL